MKQILLCLLLMLFSTQLSAEKYIVGAQNIGYYPHYDFSASEDKGVGWAILEAFSEHSGHEFIYLSMPIRRLQLELLKGHVDFVYPDNPGWYNQVTKNTDKHFSSPLTNAITGTFVSKDNTGNTMARIKRIAMPLGFTPVNWQQQVDKKQTKLVWVSDIEAGMWLVQKRRVDAIDLEMHVASHISKNVNGLAPLTLDLTLPHNEIPFMLSSLRHKGIIDELNQFIENNPNKIREIKNTYGIISFRKLKPALMKEQRVSEGQVWQ